MSDAIDYSLNKFMPFVALMLVVFLSFGVMAWQPYLILIIAAYAAKFHFEEGYSVAYCEENKLLDND
jgi:hypothetical protein